MKTMKVYSWLYRWFSFGVLLLGLVARVWAGGESEAASSDRGQYLAEQGQIIPPDQIYVDSYISRIDYTYPNPDDQLGVNIYTGHKLLSREGQEEIIHIGIQGRVMDFTDLPPLNIAFVFDSSGSMSAPDAIELVRPAFRALVSRLRAQDRLSVVAFADEASVILPATRMDQIDDIDAVVCSVERVLPYGRGNLAAGLEAGYKQAAAAFNPGAVNRVLFLSDWSLAATPTAAAGGNGTESDEVAVERDRLLTLAAENKAKGINVSTIGVGQDFNLDLMVAISKEGGGSSGFMGDEAKARDLFGPDFDPMVVPVTRDVEMQLELGTGVELLATWGYRHTIEGTTIGYSLSTMHHRDYETILARVRCRPEAEASSLARFSLDYTDLQGARHSVGPLVFAMEPAPAGTVPADLSTPIGHQILNNSADIAQSLQAIGSVYAA